MSKLRDLVNKLPDLVKPLATVYVDMLEREGPEQAGIFVRLALAEGWAAAHVAMLQRMTTDEILAEQKAANETKQELNQNNAAFLKTQQQAIIEALWAIMALILA